MPQPNTSLEMILAHWHSIRPVFAVMGEYSAGKSTLLNFILDQPLLPMQITATNFPPVWLTYSDKPQGLALNADGSTVAFDPKDLNKYGGSNHVVLRLELPILALRNADLIDTPGISDVRLSKKSLNLFAPYLDFVIWCSNATQAWRQTEKSMWKTFPDDLRKTSIFALTQIDKLTSNEDLTKVMARMDREVGSFFKIFIPVSITDAIDASKCKDQHLSEILYTNSNVKKFLIVLDVAISQAITACAERKKSLHSLQGASQLTTKVSKNGEKKVGKLAEQLPTLTLKNSTREYPMADVDISKLTDIGGFIGACLVDSETGLMMASEGGGRLDLEVAGAANTEVVKAKLAAIEMLGLDDHIDDILITLGKQFHLIRPLEKSPTVFLYVALDKKSANLGMARVQVKNVERKLKM